MCNMSILAWFCLARSHVYLHVCVLLTLKPKYAEQETTKNKQIQRALDRVLCLYKHLKRNNKV